MEHYLYTIEFIVQSLKITKQNECAPEHYPHFAEFRFREGIFVSMHEQDFGFLSVLGKAVYQQEHLDSRKSGTCDKRLGRVCAFTLRRDVDTSDMLDIRVYKKKSDKCKFLIGAAEIPMMKQFDQVMNRYYTVNAGSLYGGVKPPSIRKAPPSRGFSTSLLIPHQPEEEAEYDRTDKQYTEAELEERKTKKTPSEEVPTSKEYVGENEMGIHINDVPFNPDESAYITFKAAVQLRNMKGEGTGFLVVLVRLACMGQSVCTEIPYPSDDQEGKMKDCLCPMFDKDFEKCDPEEKQPKEKPEKPSYESTDSSSSYVSEEDESTISVPPTITPRVDKTAYDEFEADLNGCGLAIRVLKNSHRVSGVKRYEDPASCCNTCKTGGNSDQKTAVARLLQLVCKVLMSLTSEQDKPTQCENMTNPCNKAPNLEQICQCIQRMLGNEKPFPNDNKKCSDDRLSMNKCGQKSWQSPRCKPTMTTRRKKLVNPCSNRDRDGCECDSQRNIMLFLQSIRQVVANKKGLSDLADLLLQCTCGNRNDGGGDNKSGLTSILKIILEKIKNCADDRPAMEKQMDLCGLVQTLAELQNNGSSRKRGGETCSYGSDSTRTSIQSSENVSCLVKKILELGVKYCSNRNVNLRNILCKVLSDDVCNEELTNICRTVCQYLESDRNVVCDHVRKETAGRVVNAPCLPEVRGTIKYPANMDYGTTNFSLPLLNRCDDEGGVDKYRRKNKQRECCVQIEGRDIDNTMQGINQKLPEGIEICRKGTMDLDSDVFILRMGKKAATADKKGLIEIELRTPKGPTGGRPQLVSTSTQVDEDMLTERISGLPPAKKSKGGKKGKGKKGNKK